MKCPQCNAWALVKETRQRNNNITRRRYECGNEHRFTTEEQAIKHKPIIDNAQLTEDEND